MKDPRQTLSFALEKYPERLEIAPLSELVMDTARQNERRPAWAKIALPDEAVKGLRGGGDGSLFLVRVPEEVAARVDSPIVLPGEVE